jgi:5-methylcytosine-specific restriction endonuclease McrA
MPYKTKEAKAEAQRRWHATPEGLQWRRGWGRRYYQANTAKCRAWSASYDAAHPESRVARNQNRRARRGARLTAADVRAARAMGDGVCAYCLAKSDALVLEHCTPLARGGANTLDNIVMACKPCNARKYTRTVLEFTINA